MSKHDEKETKRLVKDLRWYANRFRKDSTFESSCKAVMLLAANTLEAKCQLDRHDSAFQEQRLWFEQYEGHVFIRYESADGLSQTVRWYGKNPPPARFTRPVAWVVNFESFETHTPPAIRTYQYAGTVFGSGQAILRYHEVLE